MLSVNTNFSAINSFSSLRQSQNSVAKGFERLSSGLRINGANDDAAGLSISTRMTAQIKGTQQSIRNANDGVSFLQTAEGALTETTNILQRMRELVVQSGNETLNSQDRTAIQEELNQLSKEVDRINESTNFNGQTIFSQHKSVSVEQSRANGGELRGYNITFDTSAVLSGAEAETRRDTVIGNMQSSWLRESELRIEKFYGLEGNGNDITITFAENGLNGTLASVTSGSPQVMEIDLDDFDDTNQPHGGIANYYSDRIVAHEMVHAAMNANNVRQDAADSQWFNEGAAELIIGAADTRMNGATTDGDLQIMVDEAFNNTPINYAGAYIAAAFLHQEIIQNGGSGINDLFQELKSNGNDFDAALSATAGYTGQSGFAGDFATRGLEFAKELRDTAVSSGDTGAVGGYILDNNSIYNAEDIIDNTHLSANRKIGGRILTLHIGTNADHELETYVGSFNTNAMALSTVNVEAHDKVDAALTTIDDALNYVSANRSQLGALQNRLSSTIQSLSIQEETTSASRSRILDADFATETTKLTSTQIIQRAATSVLAQANTAPQLALSLL
jgi:flagellin